MRCENLNSILGGKPVGKIAFGSRRLTRRWDDDIKMEFI
jgi:hypothetical protein